MTKGSAPIGDRSQWADRVLSRALQNPDEVTSNSHDFAFDMADRLDRHGEKTLVSKAQLSWIEDIEARLEEQGL